MSSRYENFEFNYILSEMPNEEVVGDVAFSSFPWSTMRWCRRPDQEPLFKSIVGPGLGSACLMSQESIW